MSKDPSISKRVVPEFGDFDPRTLKVLVVDPVVMRCCICNVRLDVEDRKYEVLISMHGNICLHSEPEPGDTLKLACEWCYEEVERDKVHEDGYAELGRFLRDRRRAVDAERYKGVHYYRVISDKLHHPKSRETKFAEFWARLQRTHQIMRELAILPCQRDDEGAFDTGEMGFARPERVRLGLECGITDRDAVVSATVFQWLGTNVGFDFLRQVLDEVGYTLTRKDKSGM